MKDHDFEAEKEKREEGWRPSDKSGEEALKTEERSLDIGEAGQHAPGGYYNQQGVNAPDRSTLKDDDLAPEGRRQKAVGSRQKAEGRRQ